GAGGIKVRVIALVFQTLGAGEAALGKAVRQVLQCVIDDLGEGVLIDDVLTELSDDDAGVGGSEVRAHAGEGLLEQGAVFVGVLVGVERGAAAGACSSVALKVKARGSGVRSSSSTWPRPAIFDCPARR